MILQNSRNCFSVLYVLLRYQSEGRDLISVIGDEVLKRIPIIICDLLRRQAGRHGGKESSACENIATKETERSEKELSKPEDTMARIQDLFPDLLLIATTRSRPGRLL